MIVDRDFRRGRATTLLVAATVLVATRPAWADMDDDTDQFHPDVFACEDALAKLEACCLGFVADRLRCVRLSVKDTSCGYGRYWREEPVLSPSDAACIDARSCEALVADRVCARALAATSRRESGAWEHGSAFADQPQTSAPRSPVCP